jgi:hypothetical protein
MGPCSLSYATTHMGIQKWPLTAIGMPGACLHTDIRLLRCVPAVSPPVLGEAPSSTIKWPLERKVVNTDEEESARQHSPVTKAALALPNHALAISVQTVPSHPSDGENESPRLAAHERHRPADVVNAKLETSNGTRQHAMPNAAHSTAQCPAKASSVLLRPGNKTVVSNEERSAVWYSPVTKAAPTLPSQLLAASMRATFPCP